MKTLDKQLEDKRKELSKLETFTNKKINIFKRNITPIKNILSIYKVSLVNYDGFITKSIVNDSLQLLVTVTMDGTCKLSEKRKSNLIKKLQSLVPISNMDKILHGKIIIRYYS